MKLGNVLSRTLKPPVTAVNSGLWGRPRHLPLHSPSPEFAFLWVSGWEGTTCCGMGHRALSRRLLQNLFKRLSAHVALTSSRPTPSCGPQALPWPLQTFSAVAHNTLVVLLHAGATLAFLQGRVCVTAPPQAAGLCTRSSAARDILSSARPPFFLHLSARSSSP